MVTLLTVDKRLDDKGLKRLIEYLVSGGVHGILGLFLLAIFNVRIKRWQGIDSVIVSIFIIICGTFLRDLSPQYEWLQCSIDPIIIGANATAGLMFLALIFVALNKQKGSPLY